MSLFPTFILAMKEGYGVVGSFTQSLSLLGGTTSVALGWITVIVGAIAGAIAIFDGLTTSVKEAQESLQEFKKATDELENTKSELESINDKIEEIKDKGPLSITDKAELAKLEKEKELLEQQVKLLELKAELAGQKSNSDGIKATNSMWKGTGWHSGVGFSTDSGTIYNLTGHIQGGDGVYQDTNANGKIEQYENKIKELEDKKTNESDPKKKQKYQEDIIEYQGKIADAKIELSEILVQDQELLEQITGDDPASKAAREKLQAEIDFLESQIYSQEELDKKEFDKFVSDNKDLETTFRSLTNNGTEVTADSVKTLLKLFPGLEKYVENTDDGAIQLAKDLGVLATTTDETAEGANTLSSALNEASSAYELLHNAQKEFNDDGKLSSDTIQEILSKYPELEDEMYEYIMGIRSGASVMDLLQQKTNETTTMSAQAFRKMYLSSSAVSQDMVVDYKEAFTAIGLGWSDTQSIMANVNSQIIDANGLATKTFVEQWGEAAKQAGVSVQSFAQGLASLLTGGLFDGTEGAYVKDGYAWQHNADGTYYTFANTETTKILNDLKKNGKDSQYYAQYGGKSKDEIYNSVNDWYVARIAKNQADKAEWDAKQKEFEERMKQFGVDDDSGDKDYSDYWDELLEARENDIKNVQDTIDRTNTKLEYALKTGNAEQINIFSSELDDLYSQRKALLEKHAKEARDDLALIMQSIYDIAPELVGKGINEISPYEIEAISQSLSGNDYAQDRWDNLVDTAQSYYETIQSFSDEWWDNEKEHLDTIEEYYDNVLDEIDRYVDRIENARQDEIDALDKQITREEALLKIKQGQFDATNNLKEAQKDINKEIANSRNSKEYLSAFEYDKIFGEADYEYLSQEIKKIGSEINGISADFYNQIEQAYRNDQLYLVEAITAEYERQVAMKERELEIAKAKVDLEKKRLTLENAKAEKNIKQYSENGITWVADQEKVKQATEDFLDAQAEINDLQTKSTQQIELDRRQANIDILNSQKESIEHQNELMNEAVENLKLAIEDVTNPLADLGTLIQTLVNNSNSNIASSARETSSRILGIDTPSSGGSSGGGSSKRVTKTDNYDGTHNYTDTSNIISINGQLYDRSQTDSNGLAKPIKGATEVLYDNGGVAHGKGLMLKDVDDPEMVLPPHLTREILSPDYNDKFNQFMKNVGMIGNIDDVTFTSNKNNIPKNNNVQSQVNQKTWTGNMYVEGSDPNEVLKAISDAFDRNMP